MVSSQSSVLPWLILTSLLQLGDCSRFGTKTLLHELDVTDSNVSTDEVKCYCKSVSNEASCNLEKHGSDLRSRRYFHSDASATAGRRCCKWATSKARAGFSYGLVDPLGSDYSSCQKLPQKTCCTVSPREGEHFDPFSFYINAVSNMAHVGPHVSLAHMTGGTMNGHNVPRFLLYKYLSEKYWGEYPYYCSSVTLNADKCELNVDEDTFQEEQAPDGTCCHDDKIGLSFYIDRQLSIKDMYGGQPFVARRDITGADINGQRFPGFVAQKYIATLPQHWGHGIRHHGPDWPYWCDRITSASNSEISLAFGDCEFVQQNPQKTSPDRRPWHNYRVNPPRKQWSVGQGGCCHVAGRKISVLVSKTFKIPFFERDDEEKAFPWSAVELVTGATHVPDDRETHIVISAAEAQQYLRQQGDVAFQCDSIRRGGYAQTCEIHESMKRDL